jgi:hypothetical protein
MEGRAVGTIASILEKDPATLSQALIHLRSQDTSGVSDEDFRAIIKLADSYLAARGTFTSFLESTGRWVEGGLNALPANWRDEVHAKARQALTWAFEQVVRRMDADELHKPSSRRRYRLLSTTSGLMTGSVGLPGIIADLPTSTLLILLSIADIARSHGYDLRDPAIQAACIEAFMFGGPTDEDNDADLAFWSARAASPLMADMLPQVAARLGASWIALLPARAVPVVSSLASAAINWHFAGYFQAMGEVMFGLRPLEEKYGIETVRPLFHEVVKELRDSAGSGRVGRRQAKVR